MHLIAAIVDQDLQHRGLLSTGVQAGQIIEGGVHRAVSPVLKLTRQMADFIIFYLTSDNVLKNLKLYKNDQIFYFLLESLAVSTCEDLYCHAAPQTDDDPYPYLAKLGRHHER